ncbi:hypothetical protein JOJ87_005202 [Rhodococcus ruber]|uniref:hypothetical protein n=1 Tax=Rhodococcus ruber TaxID=1830 RepID=UPI001AE252E2|nr:hypothetical protein [Rhodococcus ruber]MBP2214790.1 hypothetical protein [Rhodococcus ruber]
MKMRTLLVLPALLLIAACGDSGSEDTAPTLAPSPTDSTATTEAGTAEAQDDFGEMMEDGARRQVQERPDDAAQLASDMKDVVGGTLAGSELTPELAQQFANVTCLSVDVESGPGAVDTVKEMTAGDFGIDEEQASELVDLAVAYRCPELASK